MPIKLRPYQKEARDAVRAEWGKGVADTLLVMSTGTGKCLAHGEPVFLADGRIVPAESLIGQTVDVIGVTDTVTMQQTPVKATFFDNGVKPIVEIKLTNGAVLRRTPNHPLWARYPLSVFGSRGLGDADPRWIESGKLRDSALILTPSEKSVSEPFHYDGYIWTSIQSIAKCWDEPTVGITVHSDNHAFVGLAVEHNTETFLSVLAAEREQAQAEKRPFRALILAHREELISQPTNRVKRHWTHSLPVPGIVMASQNDADAEVVVATVQTMMRRRSGDDTFGRFRRLRDVVAAGGNFTHLVIDECFVGDTIVDGRPIRDIEIGDYVRAFDEDSGKIELRQVTDKFINPANSLVKVKFADGRVVYCTANHPFYTQRGWVNAGDLSERDELWEVTDVKVLCMRGGFPSVKEPAGYLASNRKKEGLLLSGMQSGVQPKNICDNYGKNEQRVCIRPDETEEPHVQPRIAKKNGADFAQDWTSTQKAWREWSPPHCATEDVSGRIGVGNGSCGYHRGSSGKSWPDSISLQDRCRQSGIENWHRGRWVLSRDIKETGAGSEERPCFKRVGVDGTEILEPGGSGEFERVCPDGKVYNIEVEGLHTYLIDKGIIVHNCHHATAPSYLQLIRALRWLNPELRHLGVTATPKRSDEDGLARVYKSVAYRVTLKDAIVTHKCLVPFKALGVHVPVSLKGIRTVGGDYEQGKLGEVMSYDNARQIIVESWQKYASDRPTIAFTASVKQAEMLAAEFEARGVRAGWAHGGTPKDERRRILADYRAGRIQVLVNCALWTEGFDAPHTECVLMARPTKSDLVYIQAIGRGLRLAPGKEDCLILDFAPMDARDIVQAGDLLGKPKAQRKREERAIQEGLILEGCFTMDSKGDGIDADPDEVIVRALDYFSQSRLRWTFDGAVGSVGIKGKSDDNRYGESLAILVPQQDRIDAADARKDAGQWDPAWDSLYETVSSYQLYAVRGSSLERLGLFEDWDGASETAEQYAAGRMDKVLAEKAKKWRSQPASPGQEQFARRLGVWRPGMRKGEAAQAITHKKVLDALVKAKVING